MKDTSLKILKKLVDNNHQSYIVGGFVRDYLLDRESFDIDIATSATPKEVQKIFPDAKISPFEYGSIRLFCQGIDYEITTFRKEIKYENRRKPVEIKYINNLLDDLLRRDFTINTICMDCNGEIIDLLNGRDDLNKKTIKTIGSPEVKIKEDSLRILRAVRIATVLNFEIDKELKKAILEHRNLVSNLSYERKKEELNKILMSDNKEYGISLLKELKLLKPLEIKNIDMALLSNDLNGIYAMIDANDKYLFTKNEKSMAKLIRAMFNEKEINNQNMYYYGSYVLGIVCDLKKINRVSMLESYNKLPIKSINNIETKGNEICEILNIKPSKKLKLIIKDLERAILDGEISNTHEDIKEYLIKNHKKGWYYGTISKFNKM